MICASFTIVASLFICIATVAQEVPPQFVAPNPLSSTHSTVEASFEDGVGRPVGSGSIDSVAIDPKAESPGIQELDSITPEKLKEFIKDMSYNRDDERILQAYRAAVELNLDYASSWEKLGMELFSVSLLEEALDSFERVLKFGGEDEDDAFLALAWMGRMQDLFGNREKAVEYYKEALTHHSAGASHTQFSMKTDPETVEGYLITPFTWKY